MQSILNDIGIQVEDKIKDDLSSKGIDNTKEASNSLKVESTENSLTIKGVHYFRQLDIGRPPGKFAPPAPIQNWVKTKLKISDLKEIKSIGFLVNRKISREGTTIFKDNSKGIELEKKEEFGTKLIQENITNFLRATTTSEINTALNKIV